MNRVKAPVELGLAAHLWLSIIEANVEDYCESAKLNGGSEIGRATGIPLSVLPNGLPQKGHDLMAVR
jgi:hypothetical protein